MSRQEKLRRSGSGLGEKSFVFLLCLDESLLEEIGIYFTLAGKLYRLR